jgi:hypothetical protein
MRQWKLATPWKSDRASAMRHAAGKPFGLLAALAVGALFWATYQRFVRPRRDGKGPGDWPHSACSE